MHYLAEHLARIKSIAVSIQLEDDKIRPVKLTFRDAKTAIIHLNDDTTHVIALPEEVKPSIVETGFPLESNSSSLSFRLPTSPELREAPVSAKSFLDNPNIVVPWSASQLDKAHLHIRIACAGCSHTLVRPGAISKFKSLPSETWAEMMDFWHCHKPSGNKNSEHDYNPAYATSKFIPSNSVCFVGLSYFLFNPQDVSATQCSQCNRPWGDVDSTTGTVRVWKWNVRLETENGGSSNESIPESYQYYYYVSATICELIDSHAMYTFSVKTTDANQTLLLWIFNPHIQFTTTDSSTSTNGFKVFYSTDKERIPELSQTRGEVEEVSIPVNVYESLVGRLNQSTDAFPSNARNFGHWKAGVLDKL